MLKMHGLFVFGTNSAPRSFYENITDSSFRFIPLGL